MRGTFESVTRVAIEEIIKSHAQASKFGYVLSENGFQDLTNDIFELLLTSRTLKTAGDRMIAGAAAPVSTSPRSRATVKPRP
jgi:hypothetical protein